LVVKKGARACEELGIDPQTFQAYHKSHINKTMAVAFTGFAFEDNIENGGEAFKLGFFRAQSHKIAEKEVRQAVRQENGKLKYTGPIVRRKGDAYLVDCCVTGSKVGTADDPKFPLLNLFRECIFPMIEMEVGPGGRYEGFIPIIQGDNAGPHEDGTYKSFVQNFCTSRGWHWEPQAAQMPHMNVLDLSVFPNMSRRHAQLARKRGGLKVLSENEIWAAAKRVWEDLESAKIASGFIQAHRLAKEVIKHDGGNEFLGVGGGISVGIRDDFHQTAKGLKRKDGKVFLAPGV
jgi:hypothetical protein